MRPMVVGVDGSDGSLSALDWAGAASRAADTFLRVVYAYSPWVDWALTLPPFDASKYRSLLERETAGWCAPLLEDGADLEWSVIEADPATALLDEVRESNAGLLVLGAHGRSRWSMNLLGGLTAKLIHSAPVPVAVVPEGAGFEEQRPIVVGVDGSAPSRRALEWAVRTAVPAGRPVRAVTVAPALLWHEQPFFGEGEIVDGLAALTAEVASSTGAAIETEVLTGDPAGVLVEAGDRAGMLVLGSRGHTSVGEVVFGSVGRHCATHCSRPVVIVPAGGD